MAFERKRFLGLTVVDFSSSCGWNDEGSSVTIKMAPEDGESASGTIGNLYEFQMGGFSFTGFLERLIERHDAGGIFYEAKLGDGKELLRNVECVVSNLYGTTVDDDCLVPNYFNIFRHYERISYGASNTNESGMHYSKFISGVKELSVKCGIISASGAKFSVDIGSIGDGLPEYFRIPGPVVNLMDVISQLAEYSGKMWRVEARGGTLFVKTLDLTQSGNKQVLGSIKSFANKSDVIAWDAGVEAVNSVTSNFVIWGGAKENTIQFYKTSDSDAVIKQFWGYKIDGTPCYSLGLETITKTNMAGQQVSGRGMYVKIPTIGLEDIVGDEYNTDTIELMMVLGSQEAWELYLETGNGGASYSQVFLRAPRNFGLDEYRWAEFGGAANMPITRSWIDKENDIGVKRGARLYAFLRNIAENYWGKQYLVQVSAGKNSNFAGDGNITFGAESGAHRVGGLTVRAKLEAKINQDALDSQKEVYNVVPAESGWIDPTYAKSFQISKTIYEGEFLNEQGKVNNYIIFNVGSDKFSVDDSGADCYVSSEGGGKVVYVRATVSDKYVKVEGTPHVHVSCPQAPFILNGENSGYGPEGGNQQLAYFFFGVKGLNPGQSALPKVGFHAVMSHSIAIGFRATTNDAYGPWYVGSGGGKTQVEHDTSLTPWALGSGEGLSQAFTKRIKDISPIKQVETGSLTQVGLPSMSLGSELQGGGASVTSINVSYGPNGITSQYTFRTFTQKFGLPSRFIIERMKRAAIKQNEDRRNILKSYMDTILRQQAAYRAELGSKIKSIFLDFLGRRHDRGSPHPVILMSSGVPGYVGYGGSLGRSKNSGGLYSYPEAPKDIGKKQFASWIKDTAAASTDAIFAPFRNSLNGQGVPRIERPKGNLVAPHFSNQPNPEIKYADNTLDLRRGKIPTSYTYNPFKFNSHFETLLKGSGDEWDHFNKADQYAISGVGVGGLAIDCKSIALRGPLMVSGWGVDLFTGKIFPDATYGLTKGDFVGTEPWEGAEHKITGPVDLMWDSHRGVWTSHDVIRIQNGFVPATIPGDGMLATGNVATIEDYGNSTPIEVFNLGTKPHYSGQAALAFFSVYDNRWYIKGAGCENRFFDYCTISNLLGPKGKNTPARSKFQYYFDFKIEKNKTDPCLVDSKIKKGKKTSEHACVDTIETVGMDGFVLIPAGTFTCPGSTSPQTVYNGVVIFHGLVKEVIPPDLTSLCPTTQPPPTTQGPPPTTRNPNTTTASPDCPYGYFVQYEVVPNKQDSCYHCEPDKMVCWAGPPNSFFDEQACEEDVKKLNESIGLYKCVTTTLAPTTYPPGTTVGPTPPPPVMCHLNQDPVTLCWYCSQGASEYSDGEYTCEECERIKNEYNEGTPCTTTLAPTTTYNPESTTTTTSGPQPTQPPATTTSAPPGCIKVVTDVSCKPDGTLDVKTGFAKECSSVVQSNPFNFEMHMLKAEVKALSRKLMDLIDILEKNNIEVFK